MTSLPQLSAAAISAQLATLPGWSREGAVITKEFGFAGFTEATQFIASLAPIANAMDHHPEVQLDRYKRVKISLTTHRAGGLTQNDFDLAAKIDRLS